jgi:Tfp pilus assembly protein FimT
MMAGMMTLRLSALLAEPNHRQRLALERIEFAVGELATALLSCARSRATAQEAIQRIRQSVTPVAAEITAAE